MEVFHEYMYWWYVIVKGWKWDLYLFILFWNNKNDFQGETILVITFEG